MSKGVPRLVDHGYVNITEDEMRPPKKQEFLPDEARGRQLEKFINIPFWMRRRDTQASKSPMFRQEMVPRERART